MKLANVLGIWNYFTGAELKPMLINIFNAKEKDFQPMENVCDNMNNDPFLYYRKGSKYELLFNFTMKNATRATRKPFILKIEDGYKRFDSGCHRFFGETQNWTLHNTAFQALQRFKVRQIEIWILWWLWVSGQPALWKHALKLEKNSVIKNVCTGGCAINCLKG